MENGASPGWGDAPPMGVSSIKGGRRFEGRESATTNLETVLSKRA
jgi:hypothetical protein